MLSTLAVRTWRSLNRHRAMSIAIVAVLGVGLGATLGLFAVVNAIVLRPLPYPESPQLVRIWSELRASDLNEALVSFPRYEAYREQSATLAGLGAFWPQDFSIRGRTDSVRVPGGLVSASLLDTLQAAPFMGRTFAAGEDRPGAAPVAILSASLWRSQFGGAPDIVGSTLTIDGRPTTIIGVIDVPMVFARDCCELFVPRISEPDTLSARAITNGAGYLTLIGRLRPGADVEALTADLRAISQRYTNEHRGNIDAVYEPYAVALSEDVIGGSRGSLLMLLAAGLLVFITAAVNVGGLMLIRHLGRTEELNVQRALGADRRHLVLPLAFESLTLAIAAAVIGSLAAAATLQVARVSFATLLPHWNIPFTDPNVVMAAVALVCVASILPALAPVVSVARRRETSVTTGMPARSAMPRSGEAMGLSIFAAAQLALSFALLGTAIDLSRSIWQLQQIDLGFRPGSLLTAQIAPLASQYPNLAVQSDFYQRLRRSLLQVPGVSEVGTAQVLPLLGDQRIPYRIGGRAAPRPEEQLLAQFRFVDEGYFAALGIPLRSGRFFEDADQADRAGVAIISESVARREFGERDPIGAEIILATTPARRIVGVVGDVHEIGSASAADPGVYIPLQQMFVPRLPPMYLAVRTAQPGLELAESIRRAALSVDPDTPLARVRPMDTIVADGLAVQRLRAMTATAFAVMGLMLAGVGLYSAISYAGARRTTEFGMRLALGASPASVAGLMLKATALLVASGLVVGAAASVGLNRLLGAFLSEAATAGPLTLIETGVILSAFAAIAALIPAWRVLRMDPAQALRNH